MQPTWRRLLAALVLLFGSLPLLAAPYPSDEQLRAAIASGAALLAKDGMALEMLDARQEGLNISLLAAGLNLDDGVCLVFYNSAPVDGLSDFFAGLDAKDMPTWLAAIAVHEATHCFEQREAYLRQRFDKVLPKDFQRDNMTVQGYLSVVKSGAVETWGEALGDIASLLHLRRSVPDDWERFARGIAAMRHDLAGRWPEHDTSAWLYRVIAARPEIAPEQDIFEAALRLRRECRPD